MFRKTFFCFLVLIIACSCSELRQVITEKEKIIIRTESTINNSSVESNSSSKETEKKSYAPQIIKLWIKINSDGAITDNIILSNILGSLSFDHVEQYTNSSRLFIRSNYYHCTWVCDIPHNRKSGEFILFANLKE